MTGSCDKLYPDFSCLTFSGVLDYRKLWRICALSKAKYVYEISKFLSLTSFSCRTIISLVFYIFSDQSRAKIFIYIKCTELIEWQKYYATSLLFFSLLCNELQNKVLGRNIYKGYVWVSRVCSAAPWPAWLSFPNVFSYSDLLDLWKN